MGLFSFNKNKGTNSNNSSSSSSGQHLYYCPHCGMTIPSQLPYKEFLEFASNYNLNCYCGKHDYKEKK